MQELYYGLTGYSTYDEYINSPEWKEKSTYIRGCKEWKCDKCGLQKRKKWIWKEVRPYFAEQVLVWDLKSLPIIQVHHLTYENVGNEHGRDVQVLCLKCHKEIHNAK